MRWALGSVVFAGGFTLSKCRPISFEMQLDYKAISALSFGVQQGGAMKDNKRLPIDNRWITLKLGENIDRHLDGCAWRQVVIHQESWMFLETAARIANHLYLQMEPHHGKDSDAI